MQKTVSIKSTRASKKIMYKMSVNQAHSINEGKLDGGNANRSHSINEGKLDGTSAN